MKTILVYYDLIFCLTEKMEKLFSITALLGAHHIQHKRFLWTKMFNFWKKKRRDIDLSETLRWEMKKYMLQSTHSPSVLYLAKKKKNSSEKILTLLHSMPHGIETVIQAEGRNTY